MKCPNCGKPVPDGGRFCSFCGEKIEDYIKQKLEEGKKLLSENKLKEALEVFEKLSELSPEAIFYQGVVLKEMGVAEDDESKIEQALSKFEQVEEKLSSAELWYEKAVALGLLKRHSEAAEALEVALSYEPDNQKYKRLYEATLRALKEEQSKPEERAEPAKEAKEETLLFPSAHAVMVVAPPGEGKKELLVKAAINHLKAGDKVVFITTERSPEEVKKIFSKFKFNINGVEGRDFIFIDIFSYSVQKKYDRGFSIDNPANLNAITVNIDKARQSLGTPLVVFFDSISTLFIHAREQEIIKFFGTLISRLKANGETLCVSLQEGMHEERTVTALKHMVDSVIEVRRDENYKELRKISVVFSRGINIPEEFFLNVRNGAILLKKKERGYAIQKKYVLAAGIGALIILGVIFAFTFFKPSASSTEEPQKPQPIPVVRHDIVNFSRNGGFVSVFIVKNEKAKNKGFLVLDTPYYNISINLDRSYFLIYDKLNSHPLTVYNDTVDNPTDMLTGVDIGYADLDGVNKLPFSTTALHDEDGLSFTIVTTNEEDGYVVVDTQGWDVTPTKLERGYDVEAEVLFVVFANEPYFFIATEYANLQKLGYLREIAHRSPDEVTMSFVIRGDYDSLSIKGGDPEHLNKALWLPYYRVQTLSPARRPFHAGSASISPMFPDHILLGNKMDGGVIFSLPQGIFRFNTDEGPNGAQVVLEFVINVDKPEKAVAFSVDAVNREAFLYDIREASTIEGYMDSMQKICLRYRIGNCSKILNHQDWTYRRWAYAVTLVKDWYSPSENAVKEEVWNEGDQALRRFYSLESLIYNQLVSTQPLVGSLMTQ